MASLPVGSRGSSSTKTTGAGALEVREPLPAELDRAPRPGRRSRRRRVGELHDGPDGLAQVGIGHADDGDVGDRRVPDEDVLDLPRVDVHAAGDDHVRDPVGEVEVALLVDPADVAERAPAPGVVGLGRLRRVAVVLEAAGRLEPHLALLAGAAPRRRRRRRCARRRAATCRPSPGGRATPRGRWRRSRRPRCPSSTRGRSAPATRAAARFTSGGHGAAACTTTCEARQVEAAPRLGVGELEHAHEVGRARTGRG